MGAGLLARLLAPPFPDVVFCPTGGFTAVMASDTWRSLRACVGGSWLVPSHRLVVDEPSVIEAWRGAASLNRGRV